MKTVIIAQTSQPIAQTPNQAGGDEFAALFFPGLILFLFGIALAANAMRDEG